MLHYISQYNSLGAMISVTDEASFNTAEKVEQILEGSGTIVNSLKKGTKKTEEMLEKEVRTFYDNGYRLKHTGGFFIYSADPRTSI